MRPVLAAAVLAAATACSPTSGTMTGVVVDVTGSIETIEEFAVLAEGEVTTFVPSPDGDFAFPLPHLRDHLRSGEPVVVEWEIVDGVHVATFLDDG